MERVLISSILDQLKTESSVVVCGWIRTFRNDRFIALNDGSTIHNLQVVIDADSLGAETLAQLNTGAAIKAVGKLIESAGSGQAVELVADEVHVFGASPADEYPLQPKRHSLEFLREKAHLRMRTSTFSAVFRIRHAASFAIHKFFNDEGFYMMHTPIITGSDAEGAGEMFRVCLLYTSPSPRD